jgi:hypothetical protein
MCLKRHVEPPSSMHCLCAHCAGCIYVGAWLNYDTVDKNRLIYNPGRFSRPDPENGKPNLFTNTKMALCNGVGLMHWGRLPQVDTYEVHDSVRAQILFGVVTASNGLVTCRTGNLPNPRLFGNSAVDRKFYTASRPLIQWCVNDWCFVLLACGRCLFTALAHVACW